ncbi:MAG: response regulator [Solirubrobacterales bacterium]
MKWIRCILAGLIALLLCLRVVPVSAQQVQLTESEQVFIREHPVIYLGVDPKFVPYEFMDTDGQHKGIAADYLKLIRQRTGLNLVVVKGLTWPEAYERGVKKQLDVLPCVSKTPERERYFLYSEPYYSFERVLVVSDDNTTIESFEDLMNTNVAVQKNSSHHSFLVGFPSIHLTLYNSVEAALQAVADGREKVFVGNFATSSFLIRSKGIPNLKLIPVESADQPMLYFAVRNDWPELVTILNKGLASITEEEKIAINNYWIGVDTSPDYREIMKAVGIAGAVIVLVLCVSAFWIGRLRREVKARIKIEEALKLAKEDAEMANHIKSTFLARMSHEIRTPLNAITGMAYLMKKTDLNTTQNIYLDKISQAARNMLGIINDILDFSKLEAGKIEIETISFKLDKVLEDVINIVSFAIDEQEIRFSLNKDAGLPTYFLGDPTRIEQVLLNVLSNAVKFTPAGSVALSIHQAQKTDETYRVEFTVKDTGIGMTQEQLDHLFQPFDQGDSSISRRFGGTGLGLSITRSLVELMGGEIDVRSAPDQGSTFVIRLSLQADWNREDEEKKSAMVYFENIRALVVERSAFYSGLLREYLNSFSISADFVASEAQAVRFVEQAAKSGGKPYNLLLVDDDTPCEGGIAFCTRIKQMMPFQETPKCILMISLNKQELFEKIESAGLDFGISKPILPSILFDGLVDLFGSRVREAHAKERTGAEEMVSLEHPYRVLIVEDNQTNQFIARSILEQAGFRVLIAENGQEGCASFAANRQDLDAILMDLHMPVMNGFEAAEWIREQDSVIPIIAMTADAISGVEEKCREAGIDRYISKPFDPDQLLNTIRQVIPIRVAGPKPDLVEETAVPAAGAGPGFSVQLDEADGLRRFGGNEVLYRRVLEQYYHEHAGIPALVQAEIDTQAYAEAAQLVHKIKGSTGTIGAKGVFETASQLQKALEGQDANEIVRLNADFQPMLNTLLGEIKQKLS